MGGRQILMAAMQDAPVRVRTEAAHALGYLAHLPAMKSLYTALSDKEPKVRIAAFDALGQMSERFGKPLPGV
jgi:HEAT repeat protein